MKLEKSKTRNGWRTAQLGELCIQDRETVDPKSSEAQERSYLSLEHIFSGSGEIIKDELLAVEDEGRSLTFAFDNRHVLYGKLRPYLNKVALPDFAGRCTTELIPLLPKPETDREFLAWMLRRQETVAFAMQGKTGSRMPRADMDELLKMEVPFVPLAEQRRIAARLREQMAEVERARAAVQAQLDAAQILPAALLRAVFTSPAIQRWPRRKLEDVATLQRGRFSPRPRNNPIFFGGKFPFIQTGDVDLSDGYIREYKQTLNERGFAVSKMFPVGTLVISIAANIGGVGMLTFDSCMTDSLVGIQGITGEADNRFLYFILRHLRPYLQSIAPQMAQANLSIALLGPVEINLPSLAEQRKIAARLDAELTAARALVETLETRLAEIELLPATLLRDAFTQRIPNN